MYDRYKDEFFEKTETILSEYERGRVKGKLETLEEVIGIGYIVKNYRSNKVKE